VTSAPSLADALAPVREDPHRAALLLDVDGVLAPIVRQADAASVPAVTRGLLTELSRAYGVVACVTGRRASDARRLVGIGTIDYIGTHGTELLRAGWTDPRLDGDVARHAERVAAFGRQVDTPDVRTLGVRREDKGAIAAFHWRGAGDDGAARAAVEQIAARAEAAGLHTHWGRKVLEVRPPVRLDKGVGVASLLADRDLDAALYAGDDATDLDAFRALVELRDAGRLRHVVRVGVISDEGPAAIAEQADVTVEGPEGVTKLLAALRPG
jgi:trehalose 6-phosphate phosphatase